MTLKLTLELSDEDVAHFQQALDAAWRQNAQRDEKELLDGARRLLEQTRKAHAPAYVQKRLEDVGTLISMLEDPEWPFEERERQRVLAAISYFADATDMIPDQTPGIGFLDDALIAELVVGELEPELRGYRSFCEYRDKEESLREKHVTRKDWLAAKHRQEVLQIMRRRQERRRHWSTEGPTDPILRYESYDY
jgi:uncharacterized membrane protein YkvA (DUF1232 family)